jgi:hypothetical protein
MADELALYQFKDHDLLQLTDGREPYSLKEDRAGWKFRQRLPATSEAIGKVSAKAVSKLLDEIERQGYSVLSKFEIQSDWRKRWTTEGRNEH